MQMSMQNGNPALKPTTPAPTANTVAPSNPVVKPATVATPAAPTGASTPAKPKTGAEQLADAAAGVLHKVHDEMVARIDEMIVRLQVLKASVLGRRDTAVKEVRGFINDVGQGHDLVGQLHNVVNKIQK